MKDDAEECKECNGTGSDGYHKTEGCSACDGTGIASAPSIPIDDPKPKHSHKHGKKDD